MTSSAMRPPRATAATGAASNKTLNELRALGYLGPADAKSSTNVPELSSLPDPKDKIEEQNLLHSAMMSADQGHAQDARVLLKKVLELNPDSPAALRQLGELEFKAGEYRNAAGHFRSVRKAHPDDASAAIDEGKALDKLGDEQGARSALDAAVTSSGGQVEARVLLADVDLKLGDRAAADDQLEAVLLLEPGNHDALLGLAQERLEEGRFTDVVDLLGPHVKDANADLLQLLIQAYVKLGRTADAEKVRTQLQISKHHR